MSKHTPGPWRANGCEIIGNSRVVATVHWCSGMQEEDRANIALVESAPALLEALEDAVKVIDEAFRLLQYGEDISFRERESFLSDLAGPHHTPTSRARAAIAAAKGDA